MRRAPAQVALKFNPNQIRDMSAAQVKKCSAKIMSLPCTVVSSASGSLEVLDLKCASFACSFARHPRTRHSEHPAPARLSRAPSSAYRIMRSGANDCQSAAAFTTSHTAWRSAPRA